MKKILIISLLGFLISCNMERNKEETTEEGHVNYDEKKMVKGEPWQENQIQEFMAEAAMIDKMQIEIGKMAQQKAANESVGIYGKLLIDDHTQSLQNLQRIAKQRQVTISDSLDNKHLTMVRQLETAEGQAFDRRFLDMMIKGHRKDIEKYENALTSISEEDEVKNWVDNSLTSLRRHLQKAQQLQNAQTLD